MTTGDDALHAEVTYFFSSSLGGYNELRYKITYSDFTYDDHSDF